MALTQVSTKGIKDATILNADINASAAIAKSKIETFVNNNGTTRFITGTNNVNELDAESNLTVNGSNITFAESTLTVSKGTLATISAKETAGNKEIALRANTTGGVLRTLGSYPLIFEIAQAEKMRIDSSGNFCIGTTSANAKLQIHNTGSPDSQLLRLVNTQHDTNAASSAQLKFGITNSLGERNCRIEAKEAGGNFNDVHLDFYTNSASSTDGETLKMRIDSSGNTHFGSSGTLNNSNTVSIIPADGRISFGMDGRSSFVTGENGAYIYSGDGISGTTLAGDLILQSRSNQNRTIRFVTGDGSTSPSPVERGKFNEFGLNVTGQVSGKAISASSSKAGNFDPYVFDVNGAAQSTETVSIKAQKNDCLDLTRYYTSGTIQTFRFNNDFTGSISTGTTSVTYNTSSDYRLKENAVAISDGITRLKQLKPYKFNFKAEPSVVHDGFFAHEVTPIVPTAVSGEKDATETRYYEVGDVLPEGKAEGDIKEENAIVAQSLDHSKLVPLLTAALKEEITKREALETRVAALEAA